MSFLPTLYYNPRIEHPILWSNDRKRFEEKKLADECFNVSQARRHIEKSQKFREQANVCL